MAFFEEKPEMLIFFNGRTTDILSLDTIKYNNVAKKRVKYFTNTQGSHGQFRTYTVSKVKATPNTPEVSQLSF